ncbi:hypothetical protein Z042_25600 [Chania multitudinisentens RB-25]|uniref:Virulence factor VirK n=1 Tax=Chania multitudinisentens RB-25 TaxID=1441930 RepID=A0A0D4ZXQ3_9GAMM|nr:VirK/YbjX family protein [Chania multitudinisentens]AJW28904.1 hypothetical protein Z042_25600 [Chania multitudinisentens RB-25]
MHRHDYPLISSPPANGWHLMAALMSGAILPSQSWSKTSFRLKFLSRSLLHWRITHKLLNWLAKHPLLEKILHAQPNLPCKLHRPYLSAYMNQAAGLAALCEHYDFIEQRMPPKMRLGYLGSTPFVLNQITGKGGERYTLELSAIDNLNKEGEATLLMRNAMGAMLAEITFTLMYYQQKLTLFIGGLQGAKKQVPYIEIPNATKACHGLFPKRLVLESITYLAYHLGIHHIMAVSNASHIYQNWRYKRKKRDVLHADYDQFWLSIGARQLTCGYYQLPTRITRKRPEDIASKKRAEYRRRYQLLDAVEQGIAQHC